MVIEWFSCERFTICLCILTFLYTWICLIVMNFITIIIFIILLFRSEDVLVIFKTLWLQRLSLLLATMHSYKLYNGHHRVSRALIIEKVIPVQIISELWVIIVAHARLRSTFALILIRRLEMFILHDVIFERDPKWLEPLEHDLFFDLYFFGKLRSLLLLEWVGNLLLSEWI